MKNITLLFFNLFISCLGVISAQNYEFLIYKIDSIKKLESTFEIRTHGYPYFFRDYTLKKSDEEKLLNQIEHFFDEDSLFNLHQVAYDLIYSLGFYSKNSETRQEVVQILLDKINYIHVNSYYATCFKKEDYNKAAKERLTKIVFKGKTKQEMTINTQYYRIGFSMERLGIENKVQYFLNHNKTNRSEQFIKDSIYNYYVENDANDYNRRFCNSRVIRLIGWLDMKECIPDLEELLISNPYFQKDELNKSIKYTLARLGVIKFEDEILSSNGHIWYKYLHTERALFRFLELEYDTAKYQCRISPCMGSKASMAYITMLDVQNYVLNFPKELLNEDVYANPNEQKAQKGYKWLLENKGNLNLDENTW
jgi:hypothetical protein